MAHAKEHLPNFVTLSSDLASGQINCYWPLAEKTHRKSRNISLATGHMLASSQWHVSKQVPSVIVIGPGAKSTHIDIGNYQLCIKFVHPPSNFTCIGRSVNYRPKSLRLGHELHKYLFIL